MPSAAYSLFDHTQPRAGAALVGDVVAYSLGTEFNVTSPAVLTAVWWYSAGLAVELPGVLGLFTCSDQVLRYTETPLNWSGLAGSGWVRAPLTWPQGLTSARYKIALTKAAPSSNPWRSDVNGFWTAPITSGVLHAPDPSHSTNGQDSYGNVSAAGSISYPATADSPVSFGVDPEVTVFPTPPGTGTTVSRAEVSQAGLVQGGFKQAGPVSDDGKETGPTTGNRGV